jgi:hypothetical protein
MEFGMNLVTKKPITQKDGTFWGYRAITIAIYITIGNLGFIQKTKVCIKSAKKII